MGSARTVQAVARERPGDPRTALLVECADLLHATLERSRRIALEKMEALGLTELQARLLRHLFLNGPLSMRELSDYLANDPASMTALVDRLEQRELVERGVDPRDRRVKRIALTPVGVEACRTNREQFALSSPASVLPIAQLHELRTLLAAMVGDAPVRPCAGEGRATPD